MNEIETCTYRISGSDDAKLYIKWNAMINEMSKNRLRTKIVHIVATATARPSQHGKFADAIHLVWD